MAIIPIYGPCSSLVTSQVVGNYFNFFYSRVFRPSILKQILKAASSTEITVPRLDDVIDSLDELAKSGYEVAYSKLAYASKPEYDPLLGKYHHIDGK